MVQTQSYNALNNKISDNNEQKLKQKKFDLEQRTFIFSKEIIKFIKNIPKNLIIIEISKQVLRSASSIGANYIEANESLGKKDFVMRIRICLKEAKETVYWLKLLELDKINHQKKRNYLINEAIELKKIFSSIVGKSN